MNNCTRSQHILCKPGCTTNFKNYPSGKQNHILCNIKEHRFQICTCSKQTPYSCQPICTHEKTDTIINNISKPTVFDNCDLLEESFSDLLVFGNLNVFIGLFCSGILLDYINNGGTLNVPSTLYLIGPEALNTETPVLNIQSINPIVCENLNTSVPIGNYTVANCSEIDKITILDS
jgi:hypothetical protein